MFTEPAGVKTCESDGLVDMMLTTGERLSTGKRPWLSLRKNIKRNMNIIHS